MTTSSKWVFISRPWKSSRAMLRFFAFAVSVLLLTISSFGQDSIGQVTTYSALTSKNTSAALGSSVQGTGTPSQNVSKIPITSLLAPGSGTRLFTHLPVWFGSSTHQDVGYSSVDANQVQRQMADIVSRGINGVIVNWHGPSDFTDQAALLIMQEAENHTNDFEFAIEEDAQVFAQCFATSGCDVAARIVSDLTYLQGTYAKSSKYMKYQGHAVIFLYGMETYQLDWGKIRASLPGDPVLVFRSAAVATAPNVSASIQLPNYIDNDFDTDWTTELGQSAMLSGLRGNNA